MRCPPHDPRRCQAKVRTTSRTYATIGAYRGEAGIRKRLAHDGQCRSWAVGPDFKYCRLHGQGTGPRTQAGRERSAQARLDGYRRMVAARRGAGLPLPGGRPKGSRNKTPEQREREKREREERRAKRQAMVKLNDLRKPHKQVRRQQREEAAEIKRRHECFQRGQPFWSDLAGGERAKDAPAPSSPPERLSKDDDVLQFSDWGSALDHVERVMTIDRAHAGVRNLEKQFVDHLARGWLDQAEAERGYRAFMQFENLIDRGELADRRRRGRLEEAFDEWRAACRTHQMIGDRRRSIEARLAAPEPRETGPYFIARRKPSAP